MWTPYRQEPVAAGSAIAAGRVLFDRHIVLICMGTCEPLFLELVVRTLGWHQPPIAVPSLGREGRSRRRFYAEDRDWRHEHGDVVAFWRAGGEQLQQEEGLHDSTAYLADFRTRYAEKLRLDRRTVSYLFCSEHCSVLVF